MEKMKTASFFSLTAIQLGGAFCLPVLMAGQLLVQRYGLGYTLFALVAGNILLWGMAFCMGRLSTTFGLSTLNLAQKLFGTQGRIIGSLALLIPMVGWFAVMNHFVGASLCTLVPGIPCSFCYLFAAFLLIGIVDGGIKGVALLSSLSLPLLIAATVGVLYRVLCCGFFQHISGTGDAFSAVMTVMAIALAAVVDLPTYYRFARSSTSAQLSLAFVFLVGLPLIEGLGVLIGAFLPGKTLIDVFGAPEGEIFSQVLMALLAFKGLATNSANLYSAAVSINTLLPRISLRVSTIGVGLLGLLISFLPLLEHFEFILSAMAVATSSLGALFIVASMRPQERMRPSVLLSAVFVGGVVGAVALFTGSFFTGEPLCDSFLATGLVGLVGTSLFSSIKE